MNENVTVKGTGHSWQVLVNGIVKFEYCTKSVCEAVAKTYRRDIAVHGSI